MAHQKDMRYNQHKKASQKRKHTVFHRKAHQTLVDPPTTYIPTDILHITEHEIRTANTQPMLKNPVTTRRYQRWFEEAPKNLQHLIGNTDIIFDDSDLELWEDHSAFEIASDGGHDPQSGISTFGWVVARNRQIIAKGRGPVEVHPDL
jgi:hypothetical protein